MTADGNCSVCNQRMASGGCLCNSVNVISGNISYALHRTDVCKEKITKLTAENEALREGSCLTCHGFTVGAPYGHSCSCADQIHNIVNERDTLKKENEALRRVVRKVLGFGPPLEAKSDHACW